MAEFVGEGTEAKEVIGIAHEDKRVCTVYAGGEGAHAFTLVGVDIDPTVVEAAFFEDGDVFCAEGGHTSGDHIDGLGIFDGGHGAERGFNVIDVEFVVAEGLAANAPVTVPSGEMFFEGGDEIMEDFDGDKV